MFVCVFVGLLPRQLEIACIDLQPTGFVGKGSDRLQLIKFWPSRAPEKGVCGGAKIFGSALLQPARSVCVSLSAFFHIYTVLDVYVSFRTDYFRTGKFSTYISASKIKVTFVSVN